MIPSPLLVTVGEPAGIGPDCVLRAFDQQPQAFADIHVVAPAAWLRARAGLIGLNIKVEEVSSPKTPITGTGLCCWNPGVEACEVKAGRPAAETARQVITCIEQAAQACMQGEARALVTGPIDKAVLRETGFAFPGHTEFLAHIAGVKQAVMMLATDGLKVALLTTHLPLMDVAAHLSRDATLACLRIVSGELGRRFGIAAPRLALCGLNPHAGESGHFGREETDILAPAVEHAVAEGIRVAGPLPADSLFSQEQHRQYDVIVCCYHDQGLIPVKALSFGDAVNITLGLPFVRTSVDHGTALGRAGSPDVSYSSLMAAIGMARRLSKEQESAVD